jgi:hypothetical protein
VPAPLQFQVMSSVFGEQEPVNDAQVCAAGAAELAVLTFFRTAGEAVHVGGLYGKRVWKFFPWSAAPPWSAPTCRRFVPT